MDNLKVGIIGTGVIFDLNKIEKVYAWVDRKVMDLPAYIMWKYRTPDNVEYLVPKYGTIEYNQLTEMYLSSPYYSEDDFISLIGSKGAMWINRATARGNVMSDSGIFTPIVVFKDGKIESFSGIERDWKYGFINSTNHFIEVIKNGGKSILTGEKGRYTTQFALATLKSSTLGKEVCPDDIKE